MGEMDAGSAYWLRFRGRADCTQDDIRIVLAVIFPLAFNRCGALRVKASTEVMVQRSMIVHCA
jgi:hypothetical protein